MVRRNLAKLAMTLVELAVSLALGIVLIGIMVTVWTTSQKIMARTTDNIAIYQNLRTVLDTIERDIANVVRTTDMEFFDDRNGNSHYDFTSVPANAEEIAGLRGNELFYVDTGAVGAGAPNGLLPDGLGRDLNSVPYFFAPTIFKPTNYPIVSGWDDSTDPSIASGHRRDEFYFRTFALIKGESRPVMIHYRLRIPENNPQRPTLLRTVSYIDRSGNTPIAAPPRVDELADGITDLEFAIFYKESRIFDRGQFLDAQNLREVNPVTQRAAVPGLENQFNTRAVSLYYTGTAIVENTRENGVWMRPEDVKIQFGAVRPGDRFYLYDAQDDDGNGNNTTLAGEFGRKFLTVEQIIALQQSGDNLGSEGSLVFIKFVEPIDFSVLSGLSGEPTTIKTEFNGEKKRTIYQSFRVNFRVGFLPGGFRVQFKYRDFRGRRLIPFSRQIRVLGS
jgi:hypothetical protein